jgi:hypothetical protein
MTAHDHLAFVEGCFRCDLSRDETRPPVDRGTVEAAARVIFSALLSWRLDEPTALTRSDHVAAALAAANLLRDPAVEADVESLEDDLEALRLENTALNAKWRQAAAERDRLSAGIKELTWEWESAGTLTDRPYVIEALRSLLASSGTPAEGAGRDPCGTCGVANAAHAEGGMGSNHPFAPAESRENDQ